MELGIGVPMAASAGVTCWYGARAILDYLRELESQRRTCSTESEERPEWGTPVESGAAREARPSVWEAVQASPLAVVGIGLTLWFQVGGGAR